MNDVDRSTGDGDDISPIDDWMTVRLDDVSGDLLKTRLRLARIPKRFENKTLASFTTSLKSQKDVAQSAREYIDRFKLHKGQEDGLMLRGAVGCGKTHIAVAILREIVAAGYSGLYCNVPEFFKEIRGTYDSYRGTDETELIDETRNADLLVLDDLGVEGRVLDPIRDRSKWLCERMYLIVNGRYEIDKPIVMTTNCDLVALQKQFDERTISRLAEMTRARFAPFPDKDYRRMHMK